MALFKHGSSLHNENDYFKMTILGIYNFKFPF